MMRRENEPYVPEPGHLTEAEETMVKKGNYKVVLDRLERIKGFGKPDEIKKYNLYIDELIISVSDAARRYEVPWPEEAKGYAGLVEKLKELK